MKYTKAASKLKELGLVSELGEIDFDVETRHGRPIAGVSLSTRYCMDTDYAAFMDLPEETQEAVLDIVSELARTPLGERETTGYRVKLNDKLYFVGYSCIEVVAILDDAPGFLDGAKVFTDKYEAIHTAEMIGGTVEEIEND